MFPPWSIRDNLIIRSLHGLTRGGDISQSRSNGLAQGWFDRMMVRAPGITLPLRSLSGGSQQKGLLARALASDATVIVLNDPRCAVSMSGPSRRSTT